MRTALPTITLAFAIAVLGAAGLLASGQAVPPGVEGCPADYAIGAEDVLDIAVWGNTELTRTVPVRPDGKISLPLLDDVQAAGLTPMQLRESLATSLARFLATPTVSVIVREIHSFKVTVMGEVKTPGRYELRSRGTVLDALAMAGGTSEFAARGRIVIVRQNGASTDRMLFSLDQALKHPSSGSKRNTNLCLVPGDIIVVPGKFL